MKLSSDALTILSGLLGDLAVMQRKIEAGQGAVCRVDVTDHLAGNSVVVNFEAVIDTNVVVARAKPVLVEDAA